MKRAQSEKGCASHLQLLCCSCGWKKEFFTSSKVSSYFEVNRRFVYALRNMKNVKKREEDYNENVKKIITNKTK